MKKRFQLVNQETFNAFDIRYARTQPLCAAGPTPAAAVILRPRNQNRDLGTSVLAIGPAPSRAAEGERPPGQIRAVWPGQAPLLRPKNQNRDLGTSVLAIGPSLSLAVEGERPPLVRVPLLCPRN